MATLTIGNRSVQVDDAFLSLSPEEQNATVDEIAKSLGVTGDTPAEPEMSAGRAAGLAGRAAVQAVPGIALGLPALIADSVIGIGKGAYNAGRRLAGKEEIDNPFLPATSDLGRAGEWAADALGLPKPETSGERIATGAGQAAAETFGGAGLAKLGAKAATGAGRKVLEWLGEAPVAQGVIGGAAGGGAQIAAENDVNPLIGMGLGLAAGAGAVGTAGAVRAGRGAADRLLLRSGSAQEQAARDLIRSRASDPEAAARAISEGAGGELVPGSRPTTFQATGDLGLGSLERELQTANPEVFADRRALQNSARLSELRGVQGTGNPDDIVSFLHQQLDDIERSTQRAETAARSNAEAAAGNLRPSDDMEGLGRSLRSTMSDAEEAARKRESALWEAVDPEGKLTVTTNSVKQIADELYSRLTQSARLGVSSGEKAFSDLIGSFKPVESFRELQDLSSQIKAAMRDELRNKGRTPSYARLTQINQAVRSAMESSAAERIMVDPGAAKRIEDLFNVYQGNGQGAGQVSGREAARAVQGPVRSGGVSGVYGAGSQSDRRLGTHAGTQGVQGAQKRGKALSLTQFIARNGGLPLDAESTSRDLGSVYLRGYGRLARADGRSVDGYWRNKLIDNGYLRPDADGGAQRDITREIYDAIEQERGGRKIYSADDMGTSASEQGAEAVTHAEDQMVKELMDSGVKPRDIDPTALRKASEAFARGEEDDLITAYERAVMQASPPRAASDGRSAVERLAEIDARLKENFDFDLAGQRHDLLDEVADELADGSSRVTLHDKYGLKAVITRNSDGDGEWRATFLNKDGPIGHRTYDTQREAVRDTLRDGYKPEAKPAPKTAPRIEASPAIEPFGVDAEAGKRYKAATEATRGRVSTYNKGYAGEILRQGEDRKTYRIGDASVASKAFFPGPTGGERVKALLKAGASSSQVSEIASASLFKEALTPEGTIDPAKFARWRKKYGEALKELPADVRAKFANASLASQSLERAAAARKEQLDTFNKSVLGKVAKVDPEDLPKTIEGIMQSRDAAGKMRVLVQAANKNSAAKEGLRRALAEYIQSKFISRKEVGVSGENGIRGDQFAAFLKDKAPALRQVFDAQSLVRMHAIAEDIRRADRSLSAIRIPGQSNTAQDLLPQLERMAAESQKGTLLTSVLMSGLKGTVVAGPKGAAIGMASTIGRRVTGGFRAAGLRRVDELVLEIMLDPQLAKIALMKPTKPAETLFFRRLTARSPLALTAGMSQTTE